VGKSSLLYRYLHNEIANLPPTQNINTKQKCFYYKNNRANIEIFDSPGYSEKANQTLSLIKEKVAIKN